MLAISRLLPLVSTLLLGACAGTPSSSVSVSDDSACPLSLQRGQTLIVSLPGNPTSGYRWMLQQASPEQLKPLGPEVFSSPKEDLIGGDGMSTWRFAAAEAGSGHLMLVYRRPWEAAAEPAGLFDCRVSVH